MSTDSANPISLRGHFDGNMIRLDDPYELPLDAKLLITVLPTNGSAGEIPGWNDLSAGGLAAAYGDDEPEYSDSDLQP